MEPSVAVTWLHLNCWAGAGVVCQLSGCLVRGSLRSTGGGAENLRKSDRRRSISSRPGRLAAWPLGLLLAMSLGLPNWSPRRGLGRRRHRSRAGRLAGRRTRAAGVLWARRLGGRWRGSYLCGSFRGVLWCGSMRGGLGIRLLIGERPASAVSISHVRRSRWWEGDNAVGCWLLCLRGDGG